MYLSFVKAKYTHIVYFSDIERTRKYLLAAWLLPSVLIHTTALKQLWACEESLRLQKYRQQSHAISGPIFGKADIAIYRTAITQCQGGKQKVKSRAVGTKGRILQKQQPPTKTNFDIIQTQNMRVSQKPLLGLD